MKIDEDEIREGFKVREFAPDKTKNNGVIIAVILAFGMIASVITYKVIDYYIAKSFIETANKTMSESFKAMDESFNKLSNIGVKTTPKLVYKNVWIPGKSLEACMKGQSEINNTVQKCRNGYYTKVKIN